MVMIFILVIPLSGSGDMDSLPKVREDTFFEIPLHNCTARLVFIALMVYNYLFFLQNSPGNLSMSNQPGTPREDGEMGGNFLNPFQNESVSQ